MEICEISMLVANMLMTGAREGSKSNFAANRIHPSPWRDYCRLLPRMCGHPEPFSVELKWAVVERCLRPYVRANAIPVERTSGSRQDPPHPACINCPRRDDPLRWIVLTESNHSVQVPVGTLSVPLGCRKVSKCVPVTLGDHQYSTGSK